MVEDHLKKLITEHFDPKKADLIFTEEGSVSVFIIANLRVLCVILLLIILCIFVCKTYAILSYISDAVFACFFFLLCACVKGPVVAGGDDPFPNLEGTVLPAGGAVPRLPHAQVHHQVGVRRRLPERDHECFDCAAPARGVLGTGQERTAPDYHRTRH